MQTLLRLIAAEAAELRPAGEARVSAGLPLRGRVQPGVQARRRSAAGSRPKECRRADAARGGLTFVHRPQGFTILTVTCRPRLLLPAASAATAVIRWVPTASALRPMRPVNFTLLDPAGARRVSLPAATYSVQRRARRLRAVALTQRLPERRPTVARS